MTKTLYSFTSVLVLLGLAGCTGPGAPPPIPRSGEVVPTKEFEWSRAPQQAVLPSSIPQSLKGDTSVPVGLGFMLDPDMAMFSGAADVHLNTMMAMGPELVFASSSDRFLFSATVQIKTFLNAADRGQEPSRWQPYLQGGLGWSWFDSDRGSERSENSFLMNGGGGLRYRLSQNYSIGTGALINFVPGKILDDRWYFSWQIVQLVFHF